MKHRCIVLILFLSLGASLPAASGEPLRLMLDWFPNVDHVPVYVARENGYFSDMNLTVDILSPSDTSDGLKLAAAGHVDIAVSYQPQTIIAADQGLALRVVAPLVTHPLTTLLYLADSGITTPSDLSGKKIGYTVPGLMDVLLNAFAAINNIREYTAVNVGFTILPALVSGQVDAVMGPFKTYETVIMAREGYTAGYFELETHGIPAYEELIFVVSPATLTQKGPAIEGFVTALARAFDFVAAKPDAALALYLDAVPDADREMETEAFALTRPYFARSLGHDPDQWQVFADFALAHGLIRNRVNTAKLLP